MDNSLSIVVPVRNAESTLSQQVTRLLDVVSELTSRFELLIVDDASTDHTADVANELAREYPQIRVVVQSRRLGLMAAARAGLKRATGSVALVQEEIAGLSASELRQLWNRRRNEALFTDRTASEASVFEGPLMDRLTAWGQQLKSLERRPTSDVTVPLAGARISHIELSRADESHEFNRKAKPVRSFLRHLRELALGE